MCLFPSLWVPGLFPCVDTNNAVRTRRMSESLRCWWYPHVVVVVRHPSSGLVHRRKERKKEERKCFLRHDNPIQDKIHNELQNTMCKLQHMCFDNNFIKDDDGTMMKGWLGRHGQEMPTRETLF